MSVVLIGLWTKSLPFSGPPEGVVFPGNYTPRSFSRLAFMFRSDSLHAIYYTVDLFNTITDRVYIIILLQDQIYSTGD